MTYKRLDEAEKEIRLLSILPESSNANRLECILATFSLEDVKSDYSLLLEQFPQEKREEHLAAWLRLKTADPGSGCHLAPPIPPESCYRFQWGDFATLSYTWGDTR